MVVSLNFMYWIVHFLQVSNTSLNISKILMRSLYSIINRFLKTFEVSCFCFSFIGLMSVVGVGYRAVCRVLWSSKIFNFLFYLDIHMWSFYIIDKIVKGFQCINPVINFIKMRLALYFVDRFYKPFWRCDSPFDSIEVKFIFNIMIWSI